MIPRFGFVYYVWGIAIANHLQLYCGGARSAYSRGFGVELGFLSIRVGFCPPVLI